MITLDFIVRLNKMRSEIRDLMLPDIEYDSYDGSAYIPDGGPSFGCQHVVINDDNIHIVFKNKIDTSRNMSIYFNLDDNNVPCNVHLGMNTVINFHPRDIFSDNYVNGIINEYYMSSLTDNGSSVFDFELITLLWRTMITESRDKLIKGIVTEIDKMNRHGKNIKNISDQFKNQVTGIFNTVCYIKSATYPISFKMNNEYFTFNMNIDNTASCIIRTGQTPGLNCIDLSEFLGG